MKKYIKSLFILQLFLLPLSFSNLILLTGPFYNPIKNNILLADDEGVSNYEINQSVTYEITIDVEITYVSGPGDFYFKAARIPNREPDDILSEFTPPYQEVHMETNEITGNDTIIKEEIDKFNNTYDLFNATLGVDQQVTFSQKYKVKLNEIYFKGIKDDDIGDYNATDYIHDLYNINQQYFETSDPDLIAFSNSLVDSGDNPIEKAEKIYDGVIDLLEYDTDLPIPEGESEMGAAWAYDNEKGDCSEYSDLMITLLRIQDIPARKCTGFLITNDPTVRPEKGDTWEYSSNDDDALGHAWVEYYVPDIGWIVCDPTWGSEDFDYFNRIDYLHPVMNVGAWFDLPGGLNASEFSFLPVPVTNKFTKYDYSYDINIKVTDTDLISIEELQWWEVVLQWILDNIILVIILVAALVVSIILLVRHRKKKKAKREEF